MSTPKHDDLDAFRIVITALEPFDKKERERLIRWACERFDISIGLNPVNPIVQMQQPVNLAGQQQGLLGQPTYSDIKSFISEKDPKSDNQLAAAVAYFYRFVAQEKDKKESISADDLKNACRLASKPLPKRPEQTLVNALNSGFLDKGSERGHYSINTVGENLVAVSMPTAGSSIRNRKGGKGKNKKSAKKK